ncbi:MAG: biotin/lipoyl-binding protein [Deltaproteobacteria bacterium]|nr:biotin/lipoyl-binding protein [Deltaproteobacteria bacterium]
MKINLAIDDNERLTLLLAAEKKGYRCRVDGKDVDADVSLIHRSGAVVVYSILGDGRSYDVIVYKSNGGHTVLVNGHGFAVGIKNPFETFKNKDKKLHDGTRAFKLQAPIPGKIVDVKVSRTERVKKGQALVVVEAMKMENELKSPADGTITEVYVKTGDKVEKDAALLDIDLGVS